MPPCRVAAWGRRSPGSQPPHPTRLQKLEEQDRRALSIKEQLQREHRFLKRRLEQLSVQSLERVRTDSTGSAVSTDDSEQGGHRPPAALGGGGSWEEGLARRQPEGVGVIAVGGRCAGDSVSPDCLNTWHAVQK